MKECADAFRSTGTRFDSLLAIGGGSRSDLWLSMLATALNVELNVPEASELGAAFGAARLGMIAETGAAPDSVLTAPRIKRVIRPVANLVPAYGEAYDTWMSVMPEVRRTSIALAG